MRNAIRLPAIRRLEVRTAWRVLYEPFAKRNSTSWLMLDPAFFRDYDKPLADADVLRSLGFGQPQDLRKLCFGFRNRPRAVDRILSFGHEGSTLGYLGFIRM